MMRRSLDCALDVTADPAWIIAEYGCDLLRESSRETRFTISNGFLGVRGTQEIDAATHRPVTAYTYVAGLFATSRAEPAVPALVLAPDWLKVRLSVSGDPSSPSHCEAPPHPLTLDLKRGAVLTESQPWDAGGVSFHIRTLRFVSLSRRSLGLQLIQLEIASGEAEMTLGALIASPHFGLTRERWKQDLGVWRTRHSGKGLALAAALSLDVDGHELGPTALGQLEWSWTWKARPGQVVRFHRLVALTRSDAPDVDPGAVALAVRNEALLVGWNGLIVEHEAAWADRWSCSDVAVAGDTAAQQALRFAAYHLNSAANPADDRVSIGARALTGEDYRGHVFWDTEIFLLPFYVLTWPEAARTLLMYRFHALAGARAKAVKMGWRGALYAWESADTGEEVTPEQVIGPDRQVVDVLSGRQEQHISADVAFAVWQYWQATDDETFLLEAGAEILLETGRFWSSRAQLEADAHSHIRGVMGPDEYHADIDDNAYTNVMARWNIRRALDVAALLSQRWPDRWAALSAQLDLNDAELRQWRSVADSIATGLDPQSGLYEQFAGFHSLEEIDLADYAGRSVPMDVVLGRERTQQSQVVKQADVVALLALLPDEFRAETGATNFAYYEPRCGHGSSLSRAMHGLAAARLGETEKALRYFQQTAAIDLADTHVAIAGGVHIAALGGLWQIAVFGFAGLSLRTDGVALNPQLPTRWLSLGFSLQWRGRHLKIRIDQTTECVQATLTGGEPMALFISGERHALLRDQPLLVRA